MTLDNYVTASTTRVKGDKNVPRDKFERLKEAAQKKLTLHSLRSKANLNGVNIEFQGNSKHQYDFWTLNWHQASQASPIHSRVISAIGVEGREPSAFYCPETHESLFFNTEYYGQCKSWALGMAAAILEQTKNTHSSYLVGKQPEKSLYMRTESQLNKPWLRKIFDESKCENVVMSKKNCEFTQGPTGCKLTNQRCVFDDGYQWCYYAFGNSRALVPREQLFGKDKVADEAKIRLLVLLRRDEKSPEEVKLNSDEAIQVLRKGEYMIRPGAGPKELWGKISNEPWFNPYLLHLDHARQEEFFRRMISSFKVNCILLNTGIETVEGTNSRILSALENC